MSGGRICTCGKIWDLHIHSNQCYSCTDPVLRNFGVDEYVDKIIKVFNEYPDLDMVSFTDHNSISIDLYRAFYQANTCVALLPGIEIDVALEPNGISKHLLVYFDAVGDMSKLEGLARKLNTFLDENKVSSTSPIYIPRLLSELVGYGVHFALSPHAMKQGKRGIEYDWHALPHDMQDTEIKKYLDQFFCFWESSGSSEIAHAVDYLKRMSRNDLISVVAFSDSKDFEKLRSYLESPCQYFNALPNFNGLKLAGSDISRITKVQSRVDEADLGSYIGRVDFGGQSLEFSPRLNAIIGGRGSGKSVLLDSIAKAVNPSLLDRLQDERKAFITSRPVTLETMSDSPIIAGQFRLDYFNQSYIAKLFEKSGDEFNRELEAYFADPFSKVVPIDRGEIERENASRFSGLLESFDSEMPGNIVGFVEKYIVDTKDKLDIAIYARKSKLTVQDAKLAAFGYSEAVAKIHSAVISNLPITLASDPEVLNALAELEKTVCRRGHEHKRLYLESTFLHNHFVDVFIDKKASISKAQKTRQEQIDLFSSTFADKTLGMRKRVSLVRSLVQMCEGFTAYYERHVFERGERDGAFKFVRELRVEHPIDFMVRAFNQCVLALPGVGACSRDNLWSYIDHFCFSEDGYRKGSDWECLYDKLKSFGLEYKETSLILFDDGDGSYRDLRTLSPGTQTNILIEYIVHKDTNVPLLIDQPEDNVDNQTIYNKIRSWFMNLKRTRQVIVVTHDANIVINADAENVIVAEQPEPGRFKYDYGALEYGDIIDRASLVLDGGKDAVRRRLVKYGD